ncbi:MAG: lysine--tRNA ligase [Phycisphaerales bacterium]
MSEPLPDQPIQPVQPARPPHELEAQRRLNRDAAAALGLNPYGARTDGLLSLAEARARYDDAANIAYNAAGKAPPPGFVDPRPTVMVAGRVMLLRDNGKLLWLTLRDSTGDLQIAVSQKDVDERSFKFAKTTDLADQVVASGRLMKTKTGEVTVWCTDLLPAAKALATPPAKHEGLSDVELRYRQRYTDLWASPETASVFRLRSAVVSRVRRVLDDRGYMEVETPMMQVLAGGAAARPFITRMNALDIDLYLRIAPELYLKRLLVGGFPKVYEINRNFRNEGLDKQHNPEFTMLEAYAAYGDCRTVMELTETIIRTGAEVVAAALGRGPGDLSLPFGEITIDYARPFRRAAYGDLFRAALGFDMRETERVRSEAARRHIKTASADGTPVADVLLVNELFETFAEKTVDPSVPTFITDYPSAISPLVRPRADDPYLADRADLFIGGMELAPHYTELNDPDVQAAKFREQLAGADDGKNAEEQTYRTFDADFIQALKVGMPPAGGMGLGIDRLVMLLTNQRTIRDVVLFPLMRPV